MKTGYIRVPNAQIYAALPFAERARMYAALKDLLGMWAMTELNR